MEADNIDHFVEFDRVDSKDVLERKTGMGQLGLQTAHGDGIGGVLRLRGKHECNKGLEALVLNQILVLIGSEAVTILTTRGVRCSSAKVSQPIVSTGARTFLRISLTAS